MRMHRMKTMNVFIYRTFAVSCKQRRKIRTEIEQGRRCPDCASGKDVRPAYLLRRPARRSVWTGFRYGAFLAWFRHRFTGRLSPPHGPDSADPSAPAVRRTAGTVAFAGTRHAFVRWRWNVAERFGAASSRCPSAAFFACFWTVFRCPAAAFAPRSDGRNGTFGRRPCRVWRVFRIFVPRKRLMRFEK